MCRYHWPQHNFGLWPSPHLPPILGGTFKFWWEVNEGPIPGIPIVTNANFLTQDIRNWMKLCYFSYQNKKLWLGAPPPLPKITPILQKIEYLKNHCAAPIKAAATKICKSTEDEALYKPGQFRYCGFNSLGRRGVQTPHRVIKTDFQHFWKIISRQFFKL